MSLENMPLADKVRRIIAEQFGKKVSEVTNEISFVEDLEADSLDVAELVVNLEKKFNIEIPDEDAVKFKTVAMAIAYIEEKIRAAEK